MSRSSLPGAPSISRRTFAKMVGLAGAAALVPGSNLLAELLGDTRSKLIRHSTFVMGQVANATVYHRDAAEARRAITAVFDEYRRLEKLFSAFDSASEVCAINAAAGRDEIAVSAETLELIRASIAIARQTVGALDITVEPLERLWGFRGIARQTRPSDREIASALDAVGYGRVTLSDRTIGLSRRGAALDLGGVAVGYALDRAGAILRSRGIASGLLELSGDFLALEAPPAHRGWEIGIVDPRHDQRILQTVAIRNQALSTSGNYASTVVYDAIAYGHIFDPASGLPASRLLSATIIAPNAFLADAWSTGTFASTGSLALPPDCRPILIPA